ncbi:MAG: xanthine dehydrogenase family protein subunit M [Candidatus Eremiobacteraeota bacterium]|nr:xanthine dehydrogenase family protein subunit M [Candidatus Eremiobacteraeota bacterium]
MAYYRPKTVMEALMILEREGDRLRPVAGCTDISVLKEEKKLDRHSFLDLSYIKELKFIEERDGYIYIGPLSTHGEIAGLDLINQKANVLASACASVGSPQVRNRGTIGGNICHASPSGDSIPALYTLNAEFRLESKGKSRFVKASDFFTGPGKTVRTDQELLTAIRFKPLENTYFSDFIKLGQRKALACAKVSMAFCANITGNKLEDVRISLGAVAPTVVRTPKTEEYLNGKEISDEVVKEACEIITTEVTPITDLRSTDKYRRQMAGVLLEKLINKGVKNAVVS